MVTQAAGTYADLHTWDNLYRAYRKAAKGKRGRAAAAAEFTIQAVLGSLGI